MQIPIPHAGETPNSNLESAADSSNHISEAAYLAINTVCDQATQLFAGCILQSNVCINFLQQLDLSCLDQ